MILSDGRKCVTIKDAAQAVGVSTQMTLRVMKKFSYVLGETVVEQYGIPESAYFYPSLTTISQDLQLLGEQAVQNIVEMIQVRQGNQLVIAQSRFIEPNGSLGIAVILLYVGTKFASFQKLPHIWGVSRQLLKKQPNLVVRESSKRV